MQIFPERLCKQVSYCQWLFSGSRAESLFNSRTNLFSIYMTTADHCQRGLYHYVIVNNSHFRWAYNYFYTMITIFTVNTWQLPLIIILWGAHSLIRLQMSKIVDKLNEICIQKSFLSLISHNIKNTRNDRYTYAKNFNYNRSDYFIVKK